MLQDEAPGSNNSNANHRRRISNTIEMRPVYSPNEDINSEIPSSTDICFDIPGNEIHVMYVRSYCNNSV